MGLRRKVFCLFFFFLLGITSGIKSQPFKHSHNEDYWVDSVLSSMTIDQKIGQLMMIAAYSNKNESFYKDVDALIKYNHIGGLVFFQGSPSKQIELTNRYQQIAKTPLLIAMDAEWGVAMRLDSIIPFPKQMTLGAVSDNRIIYNHAAEIARQFRLMGVHINFAPVLDVNSNSVNPVINVRSFGEVADSVAEKGVAFIRGLQDNGILAVGKHFPGHGDTETDSHYDLPVIRHNMERLDSIELVPFKNAIENGINGLMIGHLNIPAMDNTTNWPASLSGKIITNTLRRKLKYEGLIFTDAMNMQGVASILPPGRAELEAFKAGSDILVMPLNVTAVMSEFKNALRSKQITVFDINEKVERILRAKYQAGLDRIKNLNPGSIVDKLNKNAEMVNGVIYENAITLVKNEESLIPFHLIDTTRFALLSINIAPDPGYQELFENYVTIDHFNITRGKKSEKESGFLLRELSMYEIVIVSFFDLSNQAGRNYNISKQDISFMRRLNELTKVVLVIYGIPYSLKNFMDADHLICAYEDNQYTRSVVPQLLFGALPFNGKLPVSINEATPPGTGIFTQSIGRLGFTIPERKGFNMDFFKLIDNIVTDAIKQQTTPGCQLLIAKNGSVVFNRSYGYQTYDSLIEINNKSLYDLASVTKVAGSIQALMMLYDKDLIDLDKKISSYLPELKSTNKKDIIIRDLLTHQAGLMPYYPFWINTLNNRQKEIKYYNSSPTAFHSIEITPTLYVTPVLKDTLWNWILNTELLEKENPDRPFEYKYSDMGFYIIQKLIEKITDMTLDHFLNIYLYEPLFIKNLTYLPKNNFDEYNIVPTGIDKVFRNGLIRGYVHDEIAAIYGGVAGHAGLFSNAYELAKILQMNLQCGSYGGVQYFQPATINTFTSRQYKKNRRGLGWDKSQIIGDEYNPASFYASESSYGHSGFTGSYVWVDPEYELIYIFLSNRTYPDADNRKLIDQEVRKRIQTVIYSSILNFKQ